MHGLDVALFDHINQGWANPFFDWLMPVLSHGNKHWLGILLMVGAWLYILLFQGKWGRVAGALIPVTVVLANLLADVGKDHISSLRPCVELAQARVLGDPLTSQGMPSGHAANTAAAAAVVFFALGRRWWPIWLLPLAVGLSRVYLGVHYPLQVAAGWGLGVALGSALVLPFKLIARRRAARAGPMEYDDDGGDTG